MQSDTAHRVIKEIASASGHSKHSILSMNVNLSKYLLAAYDPYTKYYITKVWQGGGDCQFDDMTWLVLEKLSTRELSGRDAQTTVNSITAGMTPRSADLFGMILKKDMRMGMGTKSINKVLPGLIPTHDVMLAKPTYEAHRNRYPCFGSPKIDGVRSKFKNHKFYSRGGHLYKGLDHLQELLKEITTEIDVELTVYGTTFQKGSGLIRSDDRTPNAQLHLLELPTIKESLIERIIMMTDLHHALNSPHVLQVPRTKLNNEDEVMEFYKSCRRLGYEGSVITPFDYEYTGTRSWNWMKLKPLKTYDTKVIDVYEGEKGKKYEGQMGGVDIMFKGKPNKVGGGWSDLQRKAFWEKPMMLIGRMIEVHYMEETDDGNMRHARFFDFRPDKEV